MRSIVNKDKKDALYEEDLIDAYIAKYVKLVKQMAIDYKRQVINLYITDLHCGQDRYPSKHRDLVEKARCVIDPSRKALAMRVKLMETSEARVTDLPMSLPHSI